MKEKEIQALKNIIKEIKLGNNFDLGAYYEKANDVILKSETPDGVYDITPLTSSVAESALKQAHLRFGFTVIKNLMTVLSNHHLSNANSDNYRKTLKQLSGNSSKNSGKLFVFNLDTPQKLRLAKSKDVIDAIKKVIIALKHSDKIKS